MYPVTLVYVDLDGYLTYAWVDKPWLVHIEKYGRITIYNRNCRGGGRVIKAENFAVYFMPPKAFSFLKQTPIQAHPKDLLLTYPEYFV